MKETAHADGVVDDGYLAFFGFGEGPRGVGSAVIAPGKRGHLFIIDTGQL